jgi:hypothetical protein
MTRTREGTMSKTEDYLVVLDLERTRRLQNFLANLSIQMGSPDSDPLPFARITESAVAEWAAELAFDLTHHYVLRPEPPAE